MQAQCPPIAFGQHIEIAARLCRLDDAEARFVARNGQIVGVLGRDLQEDTAVRSAFIGLPGRVQEAWTEADAGGDMLFIADCHAHLLRRRDISVVVVEVSQDGRIVAALDAPEMRFEPRYGIAVRARLAQGVRILGVRIDVDLAVA